MKIWECKIGECVDVRVAPGADFPMRRAVERAYIAATGQSPIFIFSGWGAKLDESERAVVEKRAPVMVDNDARDAARWRELKMRADGAKTSEWERLLEALHLEDNDGTVFGIEPIVDAAIRERKNESV